MSESLVDDFERALLRIDRVGARALAAGSSGTLPPMLFAEAVLTPALERIGQGWEEGRVSLSQVYMAGRICEELVEELVASSLAPARQEGPPVALVVLGDKHFLGKRMVASVLKSAGIGFSDYGHEEAGALVERAVADGIDILLISTLMLPSALSVRKVVDGLRSRGSAAKVVVGGAPFLMDPRLWREVGADAFGPTATSAVTIVRSLKEASSWAR